MGSSSELQSPLTLGSYAPQIIRPSFTALVGGRAAVVRLDHSAMFKLAEDAEEDALAHLLNLQRPRIRDAAQRLFDKGLFSQGASDLEILVTAQDLD